MWSLVTVCISFHKPGWGRGELGKMQAHCGVWDWERQNMRQCHQGTRTPRPTSELLSPEPGLLLPRVTFSQLDSSSESLNSCRWDNLSVDNVLPTILHGDHLTGEEEMSSCRVVEKHLIRKKWNHSPLFYKHIIQTTWNFHIFVSLQHDNHDNGIIGVTNGAIDSTLFKWVCLEREWGTKSLGIYLYIFETYYISCCLSVIQMYPKILHFYLLKLIP